MYLYQAQPDKQMKKAALFDLDDTLVAFDAVTESSWQEVCGRYQQKNPEVLGTELYLAIREQSDWFWSDGDRHKEGRLNITDSRRSIVAAVFKELHLPIIDAFALADDYSATRLQNMYLFSGVEATLYSLAARGYQMALITNGDSEIQRHKINRFQLGQHFGLILVEGEVGFGKPDQRIYEEALANLKVEPQETWMIGDNLDWDIAGPQALGIKGIWYDWKGKGLPVNAAVIPYRTIRTIGDLLEILE